MKRLLATTLAALAAIAALAAAPAAAQEGQAPHRSVGLGFRTSEAPIGGRWWVAPTWGVDLGLGVGADRLAAQIDTDGNFTVDREVEDTLFRWGLDAGMPWSVWRWSGVRTNLRPGVAFYQEDDAGEFTLNGVKARRTTLQASLGLEVELFIGRNVSLSASHGLEFRRSKLDVAGAAGQWSFESAGSDFAALGFHVYLFGPEVQ
jgi:hypothetical protein